MSSSEERTAGIGAYDVLLLTSLLWFLAKLLRYAFPPLFDRLALEYGVSTGDLGLAFTGFMLVYSLTQFPSGVLGDRLGGVTVVAGGALVAAAGAVLVVLASPFWLVVVAMLVIGIGTGAHKTVAIKLLSRTYPARSGRALGVHDTFGTYSGAVAPAAVSAVLLYEGVDWRTIFLVAAGVGVVGAAAFARRVPRRLPAADPATAESRPLGAYVEPFRDPRFSAFVLVTLCFGFAYNGVVAFLPLYLDRVGALPTTVANVLYGILFAVSAIQLATGELSDRVGRPLVVAATIGLGTAALAVLLVAPAVGSTIAGVPVGSALVVATLGVGLHGFRPVRGAHLQALLPDSLAGGGLGVVRTGLMGAGALAPGAIGLLAEVVGLQVAFASLLAPLALAAAISAVLLVTESGA